MTKLNREIRAARKIWPESVSGNQSQLLGFLINTYGLSVTRGDIQPIGRNWYVTHTGLLALAHRNRCTGIHAQPVLKFCDISARRWAFRATVYKTGKCR